MLLISKRGMREFIMPSSSAKAARVKPDSTSTMLIICGASDTNFTEPTYNIINMELPTSTLGVYNENQATTTAGYAAAVGTRVMSAADDAIDKILLTHDYSYFTCHATGTPSTADYWQATSKNGLLGGNNTFDGYWSVEIIKNLQ